MRLALLLSVLLLSLTACEEQGPAEQAGEEVDRFAGNLQDRASDAADALGDAARDARDSVEDAARDAGNTVEDLCEDATDRDC
ncbi:MAG: hypothetical protein R3F41_09260 [Gammaproteobacteria bacterium]|nr:hypothetical protein [Pseudomonadales bacterium]MCP5347789.1 hypothetical protein [Pseudomonadales bacterium]